ncbi:MAG: hypothetical protein J6M17_12670 [Ruminococcus sp.]|nr:hypothetical protein [Ruminococcus sp.]
MSSVSIGITAMELFAYNPFRILGIPVNATHAEISATYTKLVKLAEQGDITAYKTAFDFDSLPPFSRSSQTVKTAYAKLASNGYRCFAYADSDFSVSLNIDDIILNLRDITCYDCFLRCYMWLIINDREMKEHSLWIELANYIDKLITSKPEEWTTYFDNRFPDEMVDEKMNAYKSFYSTFCEIILLPIKEMVRGSMKCRSAKEILECAGINVNEPIEQFDVRQANIPQAGQAKPKLAKALKYGDEYFDISSGTMHKYDENTAANESNSFQSSFTTPLSAESIIENASPEENFEPAPEQYTQPQQEFVPQQQPVQQTVEQQPLPSRRSRRMEEQPQAAQPAPAPVPKATEPVAPKGEPLKLDNQPAAPFFNTNPAQQPAQPQRQPGQPRQRRSVKLNENAQPAAVQMPVQDGEFSAQNPFFDLNANKVQGAQDKTGTAHRANSFSKIVQETEQRVQAASQAEQEALEKAEMEDENYFTKALIEALQSGTRNKNMQSVDTSHVVSAAEMAGPSHTTASMDNIDMRKYDETNLMSQENKKLTREQRYRDVKIDDMLSTAGTGKNYGLTPIDEFKRAKKKEVEMRKSIMFTIGIIALVIAVALGLSFGGIL